LDQHRQVVAVTLPGQVGLRFMRQAGQGKPAVGEPHLFCVFTEHLKSRFNHHPFVFGHGLSARFLNAMLDD
jgi:hypothetical protein